MVRKFWALLLCLVMVMTMMPVMVFAADSPDSTQFAGTDGLNSFNAAQAASSGESGCINEVKEGGDTPSEAAGGTQKNSDADADDLEGGNTPAGKKVLKTGHAAKTTGVKGPDTDTSYALWVNGTQVTPEIAGNILDDGTASYDAESNTLALNGADINQPYTSGAYTSGIYSAGDINITLKGENNIKVSGGMIASGIHANGVINISGSGSLNITVSGGSSETRALSTGYTDKEAGVVINSGAVSIDADGERGIYAVYVDSSYGTELPERYFKINGGTVEMDANSTKPYSCYATNIRPDLSNYEGYSATAIFNNWEALQAYDENSWGYYRYIKVQPLVYDENGISEDKEHFQPAVQAEDGYYEIGNAGNLFWFAEKLAENDNNDTLNARLVSNITMPDGMNWVAMKVGTYGIPYNGTFDGAGHTISNLSAELESGVYSNEGLFKTIGENGTVKNLGLINASIKPSSGGAGAICGTNHGLIENCYNLDGEIIVASMWSGGIAGENDGIIRQCYNTGNVESTFDYGSSIGGIAGYSHDDGEIIDCYNTGDITGAWYVGGICGQLGKTGELNGGTVKNCYGTGTATATYPGYGSTANLIVGVRLGSCTVENTYYVSEKENNGGGKTSEQFASGEVAYLLNAARSENVWGQNIGTETLPVLKGRSVYAGYEYCYSDSIIYSNDADRVHETKPEHKFEKLEYDETCHWYSCTNDGCTATNGKEAHKDGQKTYFKKAVCEVCNQEYGDVSKDITAPAGKISIGTNDWNKFLNDITFDLFFKDTQTVEITAADDSYTHDGYTDDKKVKIEYYIHTQDTTLTEDELEDKTFTAYSKSFSIDPDGQYVIYARITDHAGNVTYISSGGIVLDGTAPVITGADNGNVYCTTQKVTVTDANLDYVALNDEPAAGPEVILDGNVNAVYTITAIDKAGNQAALTVTMKPISDLRESFADITVTNVTSEDKVQIVQLQETVDKLLQEDDITNDEKEELQDIRKELEGLLTQIENAAQAGETDRTDKVEGITSDNVKLEDKDDLNSAKDDLENALDSFSGNYTEAEKTALEEKLDRINSALDSIGNVEKTEEVIGSLPDKVNPDDADAEKLINDAKKQYDALTDHEKSLVSEAAKAKLESLLDDLKDYKIIKGDGSIWTKGTERGLEFTANGSYSKFAGIEVDGETVNEENYTAVSGSTVITLKPEYLETLSVGRHTLTVLYTDGKAGCGFEIRAKADTAAQTGDESNMSIWIALAVLAALGAAGSLLYGRKQKAS